MPKRRRPTLVDLAEEAGCSPSLASIVMRGAPGASDETRRKVKAAAKRIGYRPDRRAQNLRQIRTKRIGILYTVDNPFHAAMILAFWRNAQRTGYDMVLGISAPDENDLERAEPLLAERCEALIVLGSDSTDRELSSLGREIPLVVLGKAVDDDQIDTVRVDDRAGTRASVEHLLDLGHTDIVHLAGGRSPGSEERIAGYLEAMEAAGLAQKARQVPSGWDPESGRRAAREILDADRPLPTAVVAFNDFSALGAMNEFIREGLSVPDDISIVGFDDTPAISPVVPLTTVRQDVLTLARVAWDRAVERSSQAKAGYHQVLPGSLVVRDSTGPAAQARGAR